MSQETINLLVGALVGIVSSLLTVMVGNYFQDKREIRKREWELEDRKATRSREAQDKKIEAVRKIVERSYDVSRILVEYQKELLTNGDVNKYQEQFEKIPEMLDFTFKDISDIATLADATIADIDEGVHAVLQDEFEKATELAVHVQKGETVDKKKIIYRIRRFQNDSTVLIVSMAVKLNALASK